MRFFIGLLLLSAQAKAAPVEPEWAYWRQLFDGARPAPSAPPVRQPRIAVKLDPSDEEKLKALFIGAREAEAAWPGYDFFAVPILLVEPGRSAILIGYPRPPKDFEPVPVAGRMVYVSKDAPDVGFDFRMDYQFHGVSVAAIRYSPQDRSDQVIPFAIHERFHQFQESWKRSEAGAYKAEDAEDMALAALEQEALARALESRDEQALRDFIALRAFRYGRLDVRAVERQEEIHEGMARFVDRRAASETFESSLGIPNLARRLRDPLKLAQMGKWRLYATGAAMAYILERRTTQWQPQISAGSGPYDLLAKDVAMNPEEARGRSESLRKTSAYASALAAARVEVASAKADRLQILDRFENLPGTKVLLKLMGENPQTYFSSQGWLELEGGGSLFDPVLSFLSESKQWSLRIENRMLRAIHGPSDISLEFPVSEKLGIRVNGRPWALASGSTAFNALDLAEPGLTVHVSQGQAAFDGKRLTITHP